MDKLSILTADLLDLLFENRNKRYGAYELRKTYPKRVAYALAGTVTCCLLFAAGAILASSKKTKNNIETNVTVVLENFREEQKPEPPPVEPPKQELPKVATTQYVVPKIVKDELVKPEEEMQEVTKLEETKIGTITMEGTKDEGIVTPPVEKSTGKVEAPKVQTDIDEIFVTVQRQAEYPGGVDAWRKFLERNLNRDIPTDNGAPAGRYTVIVSFVVDTHGSLSDIKAENDPGWGTKAEALRVLQKSLKWTPAEQNGRQVMYRQRQSITFQVE